jgi:heme/copper-type cytochrome/quinol oxidase subunit 2
VSSILVITLAIWLVAFIAFILAWRYRSTLKAHWYNKAVHWCVLVVTSLGITAFAAGLIYGQNTPPDHEPIKWPYDFLVMPALILLFLAVLFSFIFDQSRVRKNRNRTLSLWGTLAAYCLVLWASSH